MGSGGGGGGEWEDAGQSVNQAAEAQGADLECGASFRVEGKDSGALFRQHSCHWSKSPGEGAGLSSSLHCRRLQREAARLASRGFLFKTS